MLNIKFNQYTHDFCTETELNLSLYVSPDELKKAMDVMYQYPFFKEIGVNVKMFKVSDKDGQLVADTISPVKEINVVVRPGYVAFDVLCYIEKYDQPVVNYVETYTYDEVDAMIQEHHEEHH